MTTTASQGCCERLHRIELIDGQKGLVAPSPEVVFGDMYVAWNRTGLSLARISMAELNVDENLLGIQYPHEPEPEQQIREGVQKRGVCCTPPLARP